MQKYSTSSWPSESQDLFILSCATSTGKWSTLGTCENLYLFVLYVYNQNRLQGTSENLYLFVMYVYNQNRLQGTSENLYLFVMYAYNQNRLQGTSEN